MKKIKFKQYKHQIKRSKLEKWNLNEYQIAKVYSLKTKKEQQAQAQRLKSSVKATRAKKFYTTGLGRYVLGKKIQKLTDYARTLDYKKQQKQIDKIAKQIAKLEDMILNSKISIAKTRQTREDLIASKKDRLEKRFANLNAKQRAYFIHNTRQENYDKNGTTNAQLLEYLNNIYPGELERLMEGEKDNKGEWVIPPLSYEQAIQELIDRAMLEGHLEVLKQGKGYGYIDKTNKEVVSPV